MKNLFSIFLCLISIIATAQQIDLTNTKEKFSRKNLFKFSGGLSANSILYTGNEPYSRDPFTYYLTGNLNVSIANLVQMPFSFNLTNSGSNYTYPTMPNRLSIHPTYKWITGHIGDVSMNFSPYTLNGHLFTGVGIDLKPNKSSLKISAMYGRLQRAVALGEGPKQAMAAYKRMGVGTKIRFEKNNYQLGMSLFGAKDNPNSLSLQPDSLLIFPQENVAISLDAGVQLIKNMRLTLEYGVSRLNRDLRIHNKTAAIASYHAIRTVLDYTFANNTVGIGYERIDPGYKTLGAYYFNNDLENITLNYSRPFFKNKGNIALSGGIEHDDLNREKESQTSRYVASATVNYAYSEDLNLNLSYTSFQTYMNIKSRFEYINELSPYDNLDTLDYTQLSQNINLGINYTLCRNETLGQQLSLNLSYQEAADKQGSIVPEGNASLFYNASLGYGFQYIPKHINANLNLNLTSNKMAGQDQLIVGPTLAVNARFFDKKLTSGFSVSYSSNFIDGRNQGEVWNTRLSGSYLFMKRHSFNLYTVFRNNQVKNPNNPQATKGLTITAGYSCKLF